MGLQQWVHRGVTLVTAVLATALWPPVAFAAVAAPDYGGYRPHYQGYGVHTKGGRGGRVLKVTNLQDSGPGSLRAALEAKGPRIVVFETSGTIALSSVLTISDPYVTLAGQTAPSPGINITTWGLRIAAHDVVVQHLRFRYGDANGEPPLTEPVIRIYDGAHDVVLDHISIAFSNYMAVTATNGYPGPDIGNNPYRVALLDCLFAYPLMKTEANAWGLGTAMGHMGSVPGRHTFTTARNLYVHTAYRAPILGAGTQQIINNVIYGSDDLEGWAFLMFWPNVASTTPAYNRQKGLGCEAVIVNNCIVPSTGSGSGDTAGTLPTMKALSFDVHPDNLQYQILKVWLRGNRGPYISGPDLAGQKTGIHWMKTDGGQDLSSDPRLWYPAAPAWHTRMRFESLPTDRVPAYVCAHAGARPLDRDPVDLAAVAQTKAGIIHDQPRMGARIRSQNDMGGYPVLAVKTRSLRLPANPHAVAPGQAFRTNIEMWLEGYARALEPAREASRGAPTHR